MENASKALIIAGAILLSILIISLGLMVYNNAKSTVGSADLSESEIQAFNAKFTNYLGTSITGSQVNALIQQVISNNQSNINTGSGNYVIMTFNDVKGVATTVTTKTASGKTTVDVQGGTAQVATGKTYKVEATYDSSKGLITNITATAN